MENEYRINRNLFVIPHNQKYLLYEPAGPTIMWVNRDAVRLLKAFEHNHEVVMEKHADFFNYLTAQGIIVKDQSDTPPRFDYQGQHFDPQGLTLLLTTRCSMRCIYCYSNGGDKSQTMPWSTAQAAIDYIVAHSLENHHRKVYLNLHGGGEVTTVFDLMRKCVGYARRRTAGKRPVLTIEAGLNGVMKDIEIDWIIENIDGATVSLDGLPEIQNAQRPLTNQTESFPKVAKTLKRMDNKGFKYGIRMTVTQEHLHQLKASIDFMINHFGVKTIQIEPVFLVGRALTENLSPIDADGFIAQFRNAAQLAEKYGVRLKYSGARFNTRTNTFCQTATGNAFAVTPEGNITSCYEVSDREDPRSSLFFYGTYDASANRFVFDREKINRLRSLSVENKEYCQKCFCKWHCAGDCSAKLAALGNAWQPHNSPRCHINRELTKDMMLKALDIDIPSVV